MRRTLFAITALVLLARLSFASDVVHNWEVMERADGIPTIALYSDSNMTIKLTAEEVLPREGGGLQVEHVTAEIHTVKNLHPDTARAGAGIHTDILGVWWRGGDDNGDLRSPTELVVRHIPVRNLSCTKISFKQIHIHQKMGEVLLSLPVQGIESMALPKLIDRWIDRGMPCRLSAYGFLARERKKAKEEQDELDRIDGLKEEASTMGDILLLTNQKLILCELDSHCEKQIHKEVASCKENNKGKYIEACIRAISAKN